MIYILLILLIDADEEVIDIFNNLDNEKKIILLKAFKYIFIDEFDEEIVLYKKLHQEYEEKKVELAILYEFGVDKGYIKKNEESITNDIDYLIATHFEDIDNLDDMTR